MKTHSTNYTNTFIEVSEDCPATSGEVPPIKEEQKSVAALQFEMMKRHPYKYSSDDVVFHCHAVKRDLAKDELQAEGEAFFSKGQPCLRTSPLAKRYGWGIHHDGDGKVALYGVGTAGYGKYSTDKKLAVVKAMRYKRK